MARQQQTAKRLIQTVQQRQQGTADALILFEPELAVRAIVYHLADEGISPQVAGDSVRASVARLRRAGLRPEIAQWMWSEMSNAQRLQWLLQKTNTASRLVSDEMSVLEPAV